MKKYIWISTEGNDDRSITYHDKDGPKRWLTHPEAVILAKAHKLLAVVVHTARGVHLRSFPNQPNFKSMEIR
jgi:hypothetical protein